MKLQWAAGGRRERTHSFYKDGPRLAGYDSRGHGKTNSYGGLKKKQLPKHKAI